MPAMYRVQIDWLNDGDFADAGDIVTTRVLGRTPITARYGRDSVRALSPTSPGEAAFELNNISRDYSPDNAGSPLAGNLGPGRHVQIVGTISATDYTIFDGYLDEYDVSPDRTDRSVKLTAVDGLARLSGLDISTGAYAGLTTGQAIGLVLDAAGWPATARDLDSGATVMPWWWCEGDAWAAVQQLVASEGGPAFVAIDGAGNFVFRGRHHRITRAASTTSQATLRDSGAEPKFSSPVSYEAGWKDVINDVTYSVDVRAPGAAGTQVWSTDTAFSVADGQTITIVATSSDPFADAIAPVQDVDYVLASGAVAVTLSRTSGVSASILVKASGGPAVLTGMALRATPIPVARTVQVHAEEPSSVLKYGRRSAPSSLDCPWAGVHDAFAIAEVILAQRAERLPVMTITLKGGNDTRLTQQLARDLSDRVTIVEAQTSTNGDFYVEQIQHQIDWESRMHTTTFACEKVAAQPANTFILDTSVLGTGTLGAIGLDNPATVFVLDTSVLDTGQIGH